MKAGTRTLWTFVITSVARGGVPDVKRDSPNV